MADDVVLCETDARGVATLTLNRPEVNNAYNGEVIDALIARIEGCAADPTVRVVVVRGNGRHFQAGADLAWVAAVAERSTAENLEASERTARALRGLNELPKATVALVHGGCFGGGVGIVACCDAVVAETSALFSISEVRWGLDPSIIVPQLDAAMGPRQLRRFALSCERFGADKAQAIGLVHELCAPGELDQAAAPVIEGFLESAPQALAETKGRILADAGINPSDAYHAELVAEHASKRRSEEAAEGLRAFRDKRKPAWYCGTD